MSNTATLTFIRDIYIDRHIRNIILPEVSTIPKQGNPLAIVSHYFLQKGTTTLSAICLLCENGCAQDALVLGRTIIELWIHLCYIASADTVEEKRLRAESFIYDGERERREKFKELMELKKQGKCLAWLDELEGHNAVFEAVTMPENFQPLRSLKWMATNLGGEVECWYYFAYWSISMITHPRAIGTHLYFGEFDHEEEILRALTAVTTHVYMTYAMLDLLKLGRLRPPLEEAMKQFVALRSQ